MIVKWPKLNNLGFAHHLILPVIAIIGVAAIGSFIISTHAATPSNYDTIFGKGTTQCVDNAYSRKVTYNPVQVYKCNGTGAQQWTVKATASTAANIVNQNGYCLNVYKTGKTVGTPVDIYPCATTAAAQQWTVNATTGAITNPNSGLCLSYSTPMASTGTPLKLATCKTSLATQQWTVTYPSTGTGTGSGSNTGGGSTTGSGSGGTGSTSGISCGYRDNTWDQSDATSLGYTVTDVSHTDGDPASFTDKLNANKGTTRVVAYPDDQCVLTDATIPANLSSSWKITPPASSSGLDYEFAYDFWINTAANMASSNPWNANQEIMIWVYNNGQTPAWSKEGTLTGSTDNGDVVYGTSASKTANGNAVSVVLPQNETSGSVNLADILSDLRSHGYIMSTDTGIDDVEFGIEAPYGGGNTFAVNSFSVTQ